MYVKIQVCQKVRRYGPCLTVQWQVVLGIRHCGPGEFDIMVAIIWSLLIPEGLLFQKHLVWGRSHQKLACGVSGQLDSGLKD